MGGHTLNTEQRESQNMRSKNETRRTDPREKANAH